MICNCINSWLSVIYLFSFFLQQYTVIMFVSCRSALMLAYESDSSETIEALLRGGADTQLVDALGHKAADYSVTKGKQRTVQMFQDGPQGTVEDRFN